MNLYNLCLAVLIKHNIKVEECYVEVKKLLKEYRELEVENLSLNLIEIKYYLNEITYQQSKELIQKHFDNKEIVSVILSYDCNLHYLISDRLKNNKKIILIVIQRNGSNLRFFENELRTKEVCLAAVKQDGLALRFVPNELRTKEICLTAVKNCGDALQFVPNVLKKLDQF